MYSSYKPCNHSLYIGIIIFPHIDNTIYTLQLTLRKKNIKKETQKSEGTHWVDLSLEMVTLHQFTNDPKGCKWFCIHVPCDYNHNQRYPGHVSFVTTPQEGNSQVSHLKTLLLHEESVTWKIMTSAKAKIWLTSKCCSNSFKKSIPVFNSNSGIFNSNNFNSNSGIGIELHFQFRKWIDPNLAYIIYSQVLL